MFSYSVLVRSIKTKTQDDAPHWSDAHDTVLCKSSVKGEVQPWENVSAKQLADSRVQFTLLFCMTW